MDIKNKLLVMSGKGGVGKTTIAVNLAYALASKGLHVGLLDVDIHGPNVPKMLDLENKRLASINNKILPIKVNDYLSVMSMAFLLQDKEDSVIWRGPMKHNVIKQFVEDVEWGELDYLIIDFPPGTGDEAISVFQILKNITGSIIVSTPQQVSLLDVTKSIDFSRKVNIPIVGLIENMAGEVFGKGSVKSLADSKGISFLGSLELSNEISKSGDSGKPFVIYSAVNITKSFEEITENVISFCKENEK
jgi:ATP-binding protein involved in chromosome partitioning